MKYRNLLIVLCIMLIAGASVYLYSLSLQPFYRGAWEAVLLPAQKETALIESLRYTFEDTSFTETSIYKTAGMDVNAAVKSYFTVTAHEGSTLSGKIYKKELLNLRYTFADTCKSEADCQQREFITSKFETLFKKSLETVEGSNANEFNLTRVHRNELQLKTTFGTQPLKKI